MKKEKLMKSALAEMAGWQEPVMVEISKVQLFQLISTIQLACRHPNFAGPMRVQVALLAEQFATVFENDPATSEMIKMGWDTVHDVHHEKRNTND